MITLDFSKIDLITEIACLKLDVVKAELTQREVIIIKREPRRYLNNVDFDHSLGQRQFEASLFGQACGSAQLAGIATGHMSLFGSTLITPSIYNAARMSGRWL